MPHRHHRQGGGGPESEYRRRGQEAFSPPGEEGDEVGCSPDEADGGVDCKMPGTNRPSGQYEAEEGRRCHQEVYERGYEEVACRGGHHTSVLDDPEARPRQDVWGGV